jgi:hypothetical protein
LLAIGKKIALSFLNPIMLAGLAAALVPLVVHLLNRSRYRNVEWGAMMFLDDRQPPRFRSARLKQWMLLILRSLTLALLAISLARPVLHAGGLPPARPGRTAAVILLDNSGSMSLNDNGRIRLDLAREAIFQILSPGFRRGDDLWLLPMGNPQAHPGARYASDPQEMASLVKEVGAPGGEADIAKGLRDAVELLTKVEAPNREIYVVCDQQAVGWRGVDESFKHEWQSLTTKLPHPPRLFILPIGSTETENIAVESMTPLTLPIVNDQPAAFEVAIHNYSPVPRAAVPLSIELQNGTAKRLLRQIPVNVPAASVTWVTVPITFSEAKSHVLLARITAPGTPVDKESRLSVEVIKELRTLIIDGDEREGSLQNGADFFKLALMPFGNAKRNTSAVTTLRPDAWGGADLRDREVLILSNVQGVNETQAEAIQHFVFGGGGLIVVPGDQSRIENYNTLLPWLPAALQPATAESGSSTNAIGMVDLAHPLFRFLDGKADVAPAQVRRYFPIAAPRAGAGIIASYADGKPFLIERAVGRGRVLLMTTPVDTDWNTLPLTHFFLPFAQSAVRYVAAGVSNELLVRRNLLPGQPINADVYDVLDPRKVLIDGPLGPVPSNRMAMSESGAYGQVHYADTSVPGVYRVFPKGINNVAPAQFVVQTPIEESDLSVLPPARWDWLDHQMHFVRMDSERRSPAVSQERIRAGVDLWLPLLGVAIVMSIVELSATRRWLGETS